MISSLLTKNNEEELLLQHAVAVKRAEIHKNKAAPTSFENIKPSLLSAEHIVEIVRETGMIHPFFLGGGKDGKNKRLKKASYEGRIGNSALIFDKKGSLTPAAYNGDRLFIPANSIVFVESDLEFRLPEYIGVRFNLHIKHVHRGLLLGTGPLVDPGYWGKLCIPLHNLTSENYEISRDEGLVWYEFTRTTSNLKQGEEAKGSVPNTNEYWDISQFIIKAAKGTNGASQVPIRSSIGGALEKTSDAALNAEKSAKKTADEAKSLRRTVTGIGVLGLLSVGFTLASFQQSTINTISDQASFMKQFIDEKGKSLQSQVDVLNSRVEELGRGSIQSSAQVPLEEELGAIRQQLVELRTALKHLTDGAAPLNQPALPAPSQP